MRCWPRPSALAFWILLPLAGILASFWGILLGFPVLRLRGDYLAIVTLAFGEIIRIVLINWVDLTNGYAGITGIPRPTFFGIPFNADDDGFAAVFGLEFSPLYRTIFLYYLILALALLTAFVTVRLRRLPVGRAWEALREDEIACRSLGINTTNTKLTAFAMGAMFAGFAGSFFAARQGFISPESFTFLESATILSIVVLGGMGSQIGVAIAAIVMIGGTEIMRELDFLKQIFGADLRSDPVPHAAVRLRHGADHDLAAARPDLDARALGVPEGAQEHLRRPGQGRSRLMAGAGDTLLRVEHLTMRFGGLVAVDDLSFDGAAGQYHRADRAERRRQDHRVQLHHRLLQAERGAHRASPRRCRGVERARSADRQRQAPPRARAAARSICSSACRNIWSPSRRASPAPSRTSACFPA